MACTKPAIQAAMVKLVGGDASRLEDRGPASDLGHDKFLQSCWGALGGSWQHAAQVQEALFGVLVIERLQKGIVELLDDLRWGALGREDRIPGADLIALKSGFL